MQAGIALRIFQGLRRIGITAEVTGSDTELTVRTPQSCCCYTADEATQLAQEARRWTESDKEATILW